MEAESSTIDTAGKAVTLFLRILSCILEVLGRSSICRSFPICLLFFVFGRCDLLSLLVVDIAAYFQIEISLGRQSGGRGAFSGWKRLAGGDGVVWPGLERLQTPRGIGNDSEVAGEWRTDVGRACLRVNLRTC